MIDSKLLSPRDWLDVQCVLERIAQRGREHSLFLPIYPLSLLCPYPSCIEIYAGEKKEKNLPMWLPLASCCPFLLVITTIPALCHLVSIDEQGTQHSYEGSIPMVPLLPPSSAYLPCSHTFHGPTLWAFEHRKYLEGTQGGSSFPLITWQYHNTPPSTPPSVFSSQLWQNLGLRPQALLLGYAPNSYKPFSWDPLF